MAPSSSIAAVPCNLVASPNKHPTERVGRLKRPALSLDEELSMIILVLSLTMLFTTVNLALTDFSIQNPAHSDPVLEIIEEVELSSKSLGSRLDTVRVRARAASLSWKIEAETGRRRFETIREWIRAEITEPSESLRAYTELFRELIQLDLHLAERWMSELAEDSTRLKRGIAGDAPSALSEKDDLSRQNNLRLNLAEQLIDESTPLAARILEDVFRDGYSFRSHGVLRTLGVKDQGLADKAADQLVRHLVNTSDDRAIIGAHYLFEYFFPRRMSDLQSSATRDRDPSIRQRYFQTACQVLIRSLAKGSGNSSFTTERRKIEIDRALLAIELNSVAISPRAIYKGLADPELASKLAQLARSLRSMVPGELTGIIESIEKSPHANHLNPSETPLRNDESKTLNTDSPASPELFQARIEQARHISSIKSMIARRNISEALGATLSLEDGQHQLILLDQIGQTLRLEKEAHFSRYVSSLVARTARDLPHSSRKAETLLRVLQADPTWGLVDEAIETINGLPANDDRLLTGVTFREAFISIIKLDNDAAFDRIKGFKSISYELMARLALCEALLNLQAGK